MRLPGRRWLSSAAVIGSLAALAACSSSGSSTASSPASSSSAGNTASAGLAKAGLKFQECDGSGTPSTIASCVSQAAGAGAAGIILDAIPYGMAQNALDGAKGKGVPIIIADQYPPSGTTNSNQVAYVPGVVDQPSQIAWWLIANSGG